MGFARRPRVLVFAYACEPERGSEPGAGWGLVQSVSEFADCVVLVGPEHGPGIRRQALRWEGSIEFVEIPEPIGAASAKWHRVTWFLLYLAWLRRAHSLGLQLHADKPFDLIFHATYSTYWLPSPVHRYGVPSVWGPVGGAVVTPKRLWRLLGLRGILGEVLDLVSVALMTCLPATRRTWRHATVPLVQNETTLARLPDTVQATARVLNHAVFTEMPVLPISHRPRRANLCLFIGALVSRKGPRLALRALSHAPPEVRLHFIGDGHERPPLERLARRLKVADRVSFEGAVPRSTVFARLAEASAVVFTGLREEGGIALAEALLAGVPVIVLANGGAATVAGAATDHDRVALIPVGDVDTTARRIGEAMGRLCRMERTTDVPLLDQEYWRSHLRQAFEDALAQRPDSAESPTPARSGG